MKWSHFLMAGGLIGAFSIGAYLAPVGKSSAQDTLYSPRQTMPIVQTANQTDSDSTDGYTCPMSGAPMGSGAGMMGQYFSGTMPTVMAETLGMTVDELREEMQKGKTISEIAKEKGIDEKDIVTAMVQSRKAELEKLVKDGSITQQQMDQMLKNMETMMEQAIEQNGFGHMNGRVRGMGMHNRGYFNNTQNTQGL